MSDDDYLVLRPGPNFEMLFGPLSNPETAQVLSPSDRSSTGDAATKLEYVAMVDPLRTWSRHPRIRSPTLLNQEQHQHYTDIHKS